MMGCCSEVTRSTGRHPATEYSPLSSISPSIVCCLPWTLCWAALPSWIAPRRHGERSRPVHWDRRAVAPLRFLMNLVPSRGLRRRRWPAAAGDGPAVSIARFALVPRSGGLVPTAACPRWVRPRSVRRPWRRSKGTYTPRAQGTRSRGSGAPSSGHSPPGGRPPSRRVSTRWPCSVPPSRRVVTGAHRAT